MKIKGRHRKDGERRKREGLNKLKRGKKYKVG